MERAWQKLNLEGGGLQAVNALLAARMRSRTRAYGAWVLFPLGLHRFYLAEPRGGVAFLALSAAAAATAGLAPGWWWLLPLAALAALAVHDLFWIDRRVVAYNKELRMQLFLRKGRNPPAGYRGRYANDADPETISRDLDAYKALKETERAGHAASPRDDPEDRDPTRRNRVPSFNEQEAMLRQLAGKRRAPRGSAE
jgi:TM2 domain-containing membrane protein YozV